VILSVLCGASQARAEPVRLEWVRLEGAASCIDAAELEARVRNRLGSDPFDPRAPRTIEGVARRTGTVWHAQIAVRAHSGDANPPLRELESRATDCDALSNAVALAVVLAIDPQAAFTEAPPPSKEPLPTPIEAPKLAAPPPTAPLPTSATPPPSSTASLRSGPTGRAALASLGETGLLPRTSFGIDLGVAAHLAERLDLGLHARAFPALKVSGDPTYAIGLAAMELELCLVALRAGPVDVRACGGPSAGILHAAVLSGDRVQPGERAMLAGELGFEAAFSLTRALAFELGASAVAPMTRYHFLLDGADNALFDQPAVAGMAHAGFELRLGGP
jgi:hypothetical protein